LFTSKDDVSDIRNLRGTLHLGDNTTIPTIATGKYGILDVVVAPSLTLPLISTSWLTINKKFVVIHSDNKAFILNENAKPSIDLEKYLVATATVLNDGLYHIDDMQKFTKYVDRCHCAVLVKPLTPKEVLEGSARIRYKATTAGLNPLEVLHVKLAHANESLIKHIVKNDVVIGLGYTYDDIKDLTLKVCPACMAGRMRAFPIPPSISRKIYGVFELLSVDIVILNRISVRGFKYTAIYVDKATSKSFPYHMSSKSELLNTLKAVIAEHGGNRNPRSVKVRFLQADSGSEQLSTAFTEYVRQADIQLLLSAPYKHQQNLVERYIATIKNGLRTVLAYNNASSYYWCYAMDYYIETLNNLPRMGHKISRNEAFTGEKPDVSAAVPFFATGYFHVTSDERMLTSSGKAFALRARRCKMVGYPQDADAATKNSYLCLTDGTTNNIVVRHDCYFEHYTDSASLLSAEVSQRTQSSFVPEAPENYDELLGPVEHNDLLDADQEEDPEGVTALAPTATSNSTIFDNGPDPVPSPVTAPVTSPVTAPVTSPVPSPVTPSETSPPGPEPETVPKTGMTPALAQLLARLRKAPPIEPSKSNDEAPSKKIIHSLNDLKSKSRPIKRMLRQKVPQRPQWLRDFELAPARTSAFICESVVANNKEMSQTMNSESNSVKSKSENVEKNVESVGQPDTSQSSVPNIDFLERTQNKLNIGRVPLPVPSTLEEALKGPEGDKWLEAWRTEMNRVISRNTFDVCDEEVQDDEHIKGIKSKYAFRLTENPDGTLKYKVRLVACGYSQVYGRDYFTTYAPTAKYKSFCVIMHLIATFSWYIKGIDVENAYLESDIDADIYMYLPRDTYRNAKGKSIKTKLNKSLYGLKQAGELWNRLLNDKFIKLDFDRSIHDQCVYIKRDKNTGSITIVIVYVDDIIVTGNDETTIDEVIDFLASEFVKLTELGELTRYIGVDIKRNNIEHTISLSQLPFTKSYLDKESTPEMNAKSVPLNPTLDYRVRGNSSNPPILEQLGKLRYLSDRTRPDLLFATSILATGATNPSEAHNQGLKHVTRYLAGDPDSSVVLGGTDQDIRLFGFCDASYVPHADSKSQLAYCFFLNLESGTVCARTKKDTTVSHSSAEAEVKALDLAIIQAIWLRGFLAELGYPQTEPTVIHTDSLSAKVLAETFNLSNNTAHLVMRLNYIHQEILAGTIALRYINTENQVADVLTKALALAQFLPHKLKLLRGFGKIPIEPKTKSKIQSLRNKLKKNWTKPAVKFA
jgi:hypothetical protein